MALRQELEALEAVLAAGRHKGEWSTDAALALCRRAVEDADVEGARASRLAARGEETGFRAERMIAERDAEIASLRSEGESQRATIARLRAEVERLKLYMAPNGDQGIEAWARCYKKQGDSLKALRSRLTQAEGLLRKCVNRLRAVYSDSSYAIGIEELDAWDAFLAHDDKDRASGAESEASDEAL